MPNWRRAHIPGGTFFFTVVTDGRVRLFDSPAARELLGDVIRRCQSQWPFRVAAIVLLPEHLHTIWSLPRGDTGYSQRWAWIKGHFTREWLALGNKEQPVSDGRRRDGRSGVWQPKFWEHTLESETDFERHFDYIHFNPVKHGHVKHPADWPWSSFHRYVRLGVYPENWGRGHIESIVSGLKALDGKVGE